MSEARGTKRKASSPEKSTSETPEEKSTQDVNVVKKPRKKSKKTLQREERIAQGLETDDRAPKRKRPVSKKAKKSKSKSKSKENEKEKEKTALPTAEELKQEIEKIEEEQGEKEEEPEASSPAKKKRKSKSAANDFVNSTVAKDISKGFRKEIDFETALKLRPELADKSLTADERRKIFDSIDAKINAPISSTVASTIAQQGKKSTNIKTGEAKEGKERKERKNALPSSDRTLNITFNSGLAGLVPDSKLAEIVTGVMLIIIRTRQLIEVAIPKKQITKNLFVEADMFPTLAKTTKMNMTEENLAKAIEISETFSTSDQLQKANDGNGAFLQITYLAKRLLLFRNVREREVKTMLEMVSKDIKDASPPRPITNQIGKFTIINCVRKILQLIHENFTLDAIQSDGAWYSYLKGFDPGFFDVVPILLFLVFSYRRLFGARIGLEELEKDAGIQTELTHVNFVDDIFSNPNSNEYSNFTASFYTPVRFKEAKEAKDKGWPDELTQRRNVAVIAYRLGPNALANLIRALLKDQDTLADIPKFRKTEINPVDFIESWPQITFFRGALEKSAWLFPQVISRIVDLDRMGTGLYSRLLAGPSGPWGSGKATEHQLKYWSEFISSWSNESSRSKLTLPESTVLPNLLLFNVRQQRYTLNSKTTLGTVFKHAIDNITSSGAGAAGSGGALEPSPRLALILFFFDANATDGKNRRTMHDVAKLSRYIEIATKHDELKLAYQLVRILWEEVGNKPDAMERYLSEVFELIFRHPNNATAAKLAVSVLNTLHTGQISSSSDPEPDATTKFKPFENYPWLVAVRDMALGRAPREPQQLSTRDEKKEKEKKTRKKRHGKDEKDEVGQDEKEEKEQPEEKKEETKKPQDPIVIAFVRETIGNWIVQGIRNPFLVLSNATERDMDPDPERVTNDIQAIYCIMFHMMFYSGERGEFIFGTLMQLFQNLSTQCSLKRSTEIEELKKYTKGVFNVPIRHFMINPEECVDPKNFITYTDKRRDGGNGGSDSDGGDGGGDDGDNGEYAIMVKLFSTMLHYSYYTLSRVETTISQRSNATFLHVLCDLVTYPVLNELPITLSMMLRFVVDAFLFSKEFYSVQEVKNFFGDAFGVRLLVKLLDSPWAMDSFIKNSTPFIFFTKQMFTSECKAHPAYDMILRYIVNLEDRLDQSTNQRGMIQCGNYLTSVRSLELAHADGSSPKRIELATNQVAQYRNHFSEMAWLEAIQVLSVRLRDICTAVVMSDQKQPQPQQQQQQQLERQQQLETIWKAVTGDQENWLGLTQLITGFFAIPNTFRKDIYQWMKAHIQELTSQAIPYQFCYRLLGLDYNQANPSSSGGNWFDSAPFIKKFLTADFIRQVLPVLINTRMDQLKNVLNQSLTSATTQTGQLLLSLRLPLLRSIVGAQPVATRREFVQLWFNNHILRFIDHFAQKDAVFDHAFATSPVVGRVYGYTYSNEEISSHVYVPLMKTLLNRIDLGTRDLAKANSIGERFVLVSDSRFSINYDATLNYDADKTFRSMLKQLLNWSRPFSFTKKIPIRAASRLVSQRVSYERGQTTVEQELTFEDYLLQVLCSEDLESNLEVFYQMQYLGGKLFYYDGVVPQSESELGRIQHDFIWNGTGAEHRRMKDITELNLARHVSIKNELGGKASLSYSKKKELFLAILDLTAEAERSSENKSGAETKETKTSEKEEKEEKKNARATLFSNSSILSLFVNEYELSGVPFLLSCIGFSTTELKYDAKYWDLVYPFLTSSSRVAPLFSSSLLFYTINDWLNEVRRTAWAETIVPSTSSTSSASSASSPTTNSKQQTINVISKILNNLDPFFKPSAVVVGDRSITDILLGMTRELGVKNGRAASATSFAFNWNGDASENVMYMQRQYLVWLANQHLWTRHLNISTPTHLRAFFETLKTAALTGDPIIVMYQLVERYMALKKYIMSSVGIEAEVIAYFDRYRQELQTIFAFYLETSLESINEFVAATGKGDEAQKQQRQQQRRTVEAFIVTDGFNPADSKKTTMAVSALGGIRDEAKSSGKEKQKEKEKGQGQSYVLKDARVHLMYVLSKMHIGIDFFTSVESGKIYQTFLNHQSTTGYTQLALLKDYKLDQQRPSTSSSTFPFLASTENKNTNSKRRIPTKAETLKSAQLSKLSTTQPVTHPTTVPVASYVLSPSSNNKRQRIESGKGSNENENESETETETETETEAEVEPELKSTGLEEAGVGEEGEEGEENERENQVLDPSTNPDVMTIVGKYVRNLEFGEVGQLSTDADYYDEWVAGDEFKKLLVNIRRNTRISKLSTEDFIRDGKAIRAQLYKIAGEMERVENERKKKIQEAKTTREERESVLAEATLQERQLELERKNAEYALQQQQQQQQQGQNVSQPQQDQTQIEQKTEGETKTARQLQREAELLLARQNLSSATPTSLFVAFPSPSPSPSSSQPTQTTPSKRKRVETSSEDEKDSVTFKRANTGVAPR